MSMYIPFMTGGMITVALEAPSGSVIEIHAEGKEAKTAVDTIAQILRT